MPPLASRYACPAIFSGKLHFDALSGTPFGTVEVGADLSTVVNIPLPEN
jgi:hypothetical protein